MTSADLKNLSEQEIIQAYKDGLIKVIDNQIFTLEDYNKIKEAEDLSYQYDILQGVRKVNLNSVYGGMLNRWFKFFDDRLGASTTGCGRQITTFMNCQIGELITGIPVNWVKENITLTDGEITHGYTTDCPVLITADTDSSYFTTLASNKEEAILIADEVAGLVNDMFPDFMREAFLCNPGFDELIKAGREVVAERGLFQAKKKYMLRCLNIEGTDYPDGKFKTMGSEIKKSDTPKVIQKFLYDVVDKVLRGHDETDLETFVLAERKRLMTPELIIAMGVAKSVNKFEQYYSDWELHEKPGKHRVTLPGHVRASINYNEMVKSHNTDDKLIRSGDKVRIYYLKSNDYGFKSIGIPNDLTNIPKWFYDHFEIDINLTQEKMIDAKLKGIYSALGWDVPTAQGSFINSMLEF